MSASLCALSLPGPRAITLKSQAGIMCPYFQHHTECSLQNRELTDAGEQRIKIASRI